MRKAITIVVLAAGLAACDVISTVFDGFKQANAVAGDLEQVTGLKPAVGFNWRNGRLLSVTVTFPRLYDAKPLRDLAESVRIAVRKEFRQAPDKIELAFSLNATTPGRVARGGPAD